MVVADAGVVLDSVERHFTVASIGPVSFKIPPGRCLGLVGSNGAGKTTVMRIVVGLDRPDRGTVEVDGMAVRPGHPTPGVSGMIEEPRFYPSLSGKENLEVMCGGHRERRERIPELLDLVGLGPASGRLVRTYSQGMRQRLGIARVLLADPSVVVMDEPTNGLDPEGIRWFRNLIANLKKQEKAILLSSHMLHEIQAVSDDYLMLNLGSVIASGQTQAITGVASLEDLYFSAIASNRG